MHDRVTRRMAVGRERWRVEEGRHRRRVVQKTATIFVWYAKIDRGGGGALLTLQSLNSPLVVGRLYNPGANGTGERDGRSRVRKADGTGGCGYTAMAALRVRTLSRPVTRQYRLHDGGDEQRGPDVGGYTAAGESGGWVVSPV